LITRISVVGIAIITAALVILLSAFNGIETMIEGLYSEFDTDLTVRVEKGKSFNQNRIDISKLRKIEGVQNVSRAVEEVVILRKQKKWVDGNLIGVDPSFIEMTNTKDHMIAGQPLLSEDGNPRGIIGATLLDKLEGHISKNFGNESVVCYVPKRDAKIRIGKNPFNSRIVELSGSINYNREVNAQSFIVPLELSRELMNYKDQISAIYIDASTNTDNEDLKERVQAVVGPGFVVKTSFEKNELIYKTSQTERVVVLIILLFIFVLAAFNLVASLTMLFVEKLDNIKTMISFGATRKFVFKIFFFEGLLISGKGILAGLILGYAICFAQLQFELIVMPNSNGEAFPIAFSIFDGILIFSLVSLLSILFSYFPVKYLIRKNIQK
jgi:lipoprotein-releasing system permease protein